jgi:adenylate cyclase
MTASSSEAWLEAADGRSTDVSGTLTFGRSGKNDVVLSHHGASRRHALLNHQHDGEFWLVDLGSINGTCVNGRRIFQPVRLRAGDRIELAGHTFVFCESAAAPESVKSVSPPTVLEFRTETLWLLVADIENFTGLSRTLPPEQLAMLVGGWFLACQKIVEAHGGRIQKFLGDGILASWLANDVSPICVAAAAQAFAALLAAADPRFRFVIHRGLVATGGSPMPGEEGMVGSAMNFIFRMEKLAASLGAPVLLSEEARAPLAAHLPATPLGSHSLKGFDGRFAFFAPELTASERA